VRLKKRNTKKQDICPLMYMSGCNIAAQSELLWVTTENGNGARKSIEGKDAGQ